MTDADLLALAQSLIRVPSPPGAEHDVVDVILRAMKGAGFDGFWRDEQGNAVGVVIGAEPGPTLLFDAHCDTVGIAPGVPWQHDPFGADVEDGWLYGRGAADMKGALAAMIAAAGRVDKTRLRGRVVVSATVLEENLEGAALQYVMDGIHADYVVIGEATELNLARGGRGRAEIHLETIGAPGHSSTPDVGRNAVLDMLPVIAALAELPLPADPFVGRGVMALTDIISDPYPAYSVTPSRCRVTYDRRLLPGETAAGVVASIARIANLPGLRPGTDLRVKLAQGEHLTYTGQTLRGEKFLPAWMLPADAPFVLAALAGLRSAGLDPQLTAYQFCTNAAYSAGTANVPTIGFGPGRERDAHITDERLAVGDLYAAARGYAGIIAATLAG